MLTSPAQGLAPFGSKEFIASRAEMFAQFLFNKYIYGQDASSFIANYCKDGIDRLEAYSNKLESAHLNDERALTGLEDKMKQILAYIELVACYGKQIAVMKEHVGFREQALMYISQVHAELEALGYRQ